MKNLEESIFLSDEKRLGKDSQKTLQSLAWVSKEYNTQDQFSV